MLNGIKILESDRLQMEKNQIYVKLNELRQDSDKMRQEFIELFRSGEISFKQLVDYSRDSAFKPLQRIKVFRLLAEKPGWTRESARHAFVANGLSLDIRVGKISASRNIFVQVESLMNSTPTLWQQRVKAPEGWPWRGNILESLKELDNMSLPTEAREAVRYYFGEDSMESIGENKDPEKEEPKNQEQSDDELIYEILGIEDTDDDYDDDDDSDDDFYDNDFYDTDDDDNINPFSLLEDD